MRIAYLLHHFPISFKTFFLNELIELSERGHDVHIFSLFETSERAIPADILDHSLIDKTHYIPGPIKFLRRHVGEIRPFSIGKSSRDFEGFSTTRFTTYLQLMGFAREIKRLRIEIIHGHFVTIGSFAKKLSRLTGCPFTLTAHAYDIFRRDVQWSELRKVFNECAALITISDYNRRFLQEMIGKKRRVEVVRCGIPIEHFAAVKSSESRYERTEPRLLTVARLVEKKGVEHLLKAMPSIIEKYPDCRLTIIGTGSLLCRLKDLTQTLDLQGNVEFRGNVADADLLKEMAQADIFVLPCKRAKDGDVDGIPVSLMEAMAAGLPVVSTAISGIPELVRDGAGFLVPPEDEDSLAKAIISLADDPVMRRSMGRVGYKIVSNEFNIAKTVDHLLQVWTNILGRATFQC